MKFKGIRLGVEIYFSSIKWGANNYESNACSLENVSKWLQSVVTLQGKIQFWQPFLKNHNLSFIHPKLVNLILLENKLDELKLSRRHFSQIQIQNQSNFSSNSLFQQEQSKTALHFQWTFRNLAKFIEIESALEIYTTEGTPSLISNAINETQFGPFYTKIQQF